MILIAAAMLLPMPDDIAAQAEGWARKAKPVAECASEQDCDTKWRAASAWVRKNSKFQIAVDTPTLLSTYPAMYPSLDLAFTLVRRKDETGRPSIAVRAWCGNVFSCSPKPRDAVASLRRALDQ